MIAHSCAVVRTYAPPDHLWRQGCGFNLEVFLSITDKATGESQVVVEWNRLSNLPNTIAGAARALRKGSNYTVSLVSDLESRGEKIYVVGPDAASKTVLRSEMGSSIDYFLTYSGAPSLDGAIKGYRAVTGAAPLYGKWACKTRGIRTHAPRPYTLEPHPSGCSSNLRDSADVGSNPTRDRRLLAVQGALSAPGRAAHRGHALPIRRHPAGRDRARLALLGLAWMGTSVGGATRGSSRQRACT